MAAIAAAGVLSACGSSSGPGGPSISAPQRAPGTDDGRPRTHADTSPYGITAGRLRVEKGTTSTGEWLHSADKTEWLGRTEDDSDLREGRDRGDAAPLSAPEVEASRGGSSSFDEEAASAGARPRPAEAPAPALPAKSRRAAEATTVVVDEALAPASESAAAPDSDLAGDVVANQASGPLRAGSTDDNADFDTYLKYRAEALAAGVDARDLDVRDRRVIRVVDRNGKPVHNATIEIIESGTAVGQGGAQGSQGGAQGSQGGAQTGRLVASLRTFSDGSALFFPNLTDANRASRTSTTQQGSTAPAASTTSYEVRVRVGDAVKQAPLATGETKVTVDAVRPSAQRVKLDVEFLLDATGSMDDEIDQLKTNMVQISEQISALSTKPDVRFALTVYRDRGDEYVTRTLEFTGDVKAFTDRLREVAAGGGGDTPESLNQGLHDALRRPQWRSDAVKLVFLVADAAPHLDYTDDPDYSIEALRASAHGIKVFPIASSGLDDQGEFIFRQIAQVSAAKFLFLTYGADGASPGDETTHHVDGYEVLSLDQLVVRVVSEELAPQA